MTEEITYCANNCQRAIGDDGNRVRVTTTPPSRLCDRCEHNLREWLREIPSLYALLPRFIDNGSAPRDPDAKVAKRTEAQAPMRLEIVDLLDTRRGRKWSGIGVTENRRGVLGTLHDLAQNIRDQRGLTTLKSNPTVPTEAAFIERHLLWLLEQDWVQEPYEELRRARQQLGTAVGEHKVKPVGRCVVDLGQAAEPVPCGGPLLPSRTGGVYCPRCGDTWDEAELQRLGRLLGDSA